MVLSALLLVVICVSAFALQGFRRRIQLERELAELRSQSRVEGLTRLRNDQAFREDLELEVSRADRTGRPAALVVVSLDWRGETDDRIREAIAAVIRSEVRGVDVAYRIATAEFAMILPETRAQGALVAAARIERRLLGAGARAGSITAGIAELGPGIDRHQLFRNAYCALLAAGRDGREPVLVYSPELEHAGVRADDLASLEAVADGAPRTLRSSPGGEYPGYGPAHR